jgi:hypothetical protein
MPNSLKDGWFLDSSTHTAILELSHLKGKIQEHTGLNGFVSELMKIRSADEAYRFKAQSKKLMQKCMPQESLQWQTFATEIALLR